MSQYQNFSFYYLHLQWLHPWIIGTHAIASRPQFRPVLARNRSSLVGCLRRRNWKIIYGKSKFWVLWLKYVNVTQKKMHFVYNYHLDKQIMSVVHGRNAVHMLHCVHLLWLVSIVCLWMSNNILQKKKNINVHFF